MTPSAHSKAKLQDTEDDLDELDDVLPEFTDFRSPTAKEPGSSGRPRHNTTVTAKEVDEDELSRAFAKELTKEMEDLMRGMGGEEREEEGELDQDQIKEAERVFKAAWEAMLVEGMNGKATEEEIAGIGNESGSEPRADAGRSGSAASTAEPKRNDFQERLKQAMDKMKEAESNLQADSRPKGSEDAVNPASLEELFKNMGMEGEGGEEELTDFLENIMGQLLSKELLYDPLKELADKFPGYLASPPSPLEPSDRERYEKQQACVKKILALFDAPDYSDDNAASHKVIVELMSEVQSYGSPPPELMGPLPPGAGLGPDGLPQLGENCVIG